MPQIESPDADSFTFSPHTLRLTVREWVAVLVIVVLFTSLAPRVWTSLETGPTHEEDYRVPYALSNDYWIYEKHLESQDAAESTPFFVLGDSVIWGEYVSRDGTLSHFLNELNASSEGGARHLFVNAGVNGLFPLALEGLVRDHADAVTNAHVLLHANVLWMTSPEADLSINKEHKFNHETLVPQFGVRIPCYRADTEKRLGHLFDRKLELFSWTRHLEFAYFDQLNVPEWTLEEGNEWRSPFSAISFEVAGESAYDPDRGVSSSRHRSWKERGLRAQNFAWMDLDSSLQWAAFQRLVQLLEARGNKLLVVIGPFNEHMITVDAEAGYEEIMVEMKAWLSGRGVPFVVPETLPGELYGDSSHPLTEGYRRLARELHETTEFSAWLTE
jgi:hypothetical protein